MSNLITQYNELSDEVDKLNEQSARYKGKLDSLTENLEQAGFNSVKEAEKWLEKASKEKADIEQELNDILSNIEDLINEIEKR